MITLKIAIRNIFKHKTRSIITLSAIAFGAISLIFVGGYFEDVFYKVREAYIHGQTGHIQIFKKGFLEKGATEPFNYLIENPGEIINIVKSVKGVNTAAARIEFNGLLSTGENTVSFVGQGVDPSVEKAVLASSSAASYALLQSRKNVTRDSDISGMIIEAGQPLTSEDAYSIIVGRGLAAGINAKPGDGLILVTNTISGSINALDVTLKGSFFSAAKAFDDRFIRLPLPTAQKLLHTESVQSLIVMLEKTEYTDRVKAELERIFKENNFDLEMRTWATITDFYEKTVDLFSRLFLVVKIIITIIVVLSIYNTMNMAVIERTNEIGTIMALGTRRRGVLKLFLFEGLGLGLIGGFIGIIAGIAITRLIAYIGIPMPPPPGSTFPWVSEPMVIPSVIIFSFSLLIVTSLVSSLYPAYKASRLEIADALRRT